MRAASLLLTGLSLAGLIFYLQGLNVQVAPVLIAISVGMVLVRILTHVGAGAHEDSTTSHERRKMRAIGLARIEHLAGPEMDRVRQQLNTKLIARAEGARRHGKNRGFGTSAPALLAALVGPPGTGRTTVARGLAEWLCGIGVIDSARTVEVGRRQAVHLSPEEAAEAVEDAAISALDGILLLDDADWLAGLGELSRPPEEEPGEAAGNAILEVAERHPARLTVLLTCQPRALSILREGASSHLWLKRLHLEIIEFPGLSDATLAKLVSDLLVAHGLSVDHSLHQTMHRLFSERRREMTPAAFDNAHAARRMADEILRSVAQRASGASSKSGDSSWVVLREDLRDVAI